MSVVTVCQNVKMAVFGLLIVYLTQIHCAGSTRIPLLAMDVLL